jgi:hypothetical protein
VENDNRNRSENVFSRKIRAGRRRTYFFDVRTTKSNDYYLIITESKKKPTGDGYERHKVFIYKEDFNKFLEEMTMAIDFIKERMPDFDFDAFSHKYEDEDGYDDDQDQPRPYVEAPKPVSEVAEPEEEAEKLHDSQPDREDETKHNPFQDPTINEEDLKW